MQARQAPSCACEAQYNGLSTLQGVLLASDFELVEGALCLFIWWGSVLAQRQHVLTTVDVQAACQQGRCQCTGQLRGPL